LGVEVLKISTRARPRWSSPVRVELRKVMSRLVTWMSRGVNSSSSSLVLKEEVAAVQRSRACLTRARELTAFPAMA